MSNIAAPSRTDGPSVEQALVTLRILLGALLLICLLATFTPFTIQDESQGAGNLVNQLGYGGLAVLALAAHFLFTDRRVAASLLRPSWLLMGALLLLSVLQSAWPEEALRAVLFTLAAMTAATGVLCLPPDARSFRVCAGLAALAVLGLSYLGLVLFPGTAIHHDIGVEAQHAGLWRGIYSHKNVAGPVMAALFFLGLYLLRSGDKAAGLLVTLLAGVFVYKTGSKTTAALVPLVALMIVGARILGGRLLPVLLLSIALAGMALLTLGTVLSPTLDGVLQSILPGTTFTGRTDLWRFALDIMENRHWTGFGFESFWSTSIVFRAEAPFELSWDPRGIVNAHNGYLDIAISMGWPALLVAVFVLVLLPFGDYLRCRAGIENERLADLFLMILGFALLNSFLESYFFKRADPAWMMTWIAVVGLRLTSRFTIAERAA